MVTEYHHQVIPSIGSAVGDDVCDGLPDGSIPEFGCKSYTMCKNGDPVQVDCPEGESFHPQELECLPYVFYITY